MKRWKLTCAVFLAALSVYLSTGHKWGSGDTIPSSLIPITVLLHGTVRLDGFAPTLKTQWGNRLPYFLERTRHGIVSIYPVATGLLAATIESIPVLAINAKRSPTPEQWLAYAHRLEFYAAAIITAASAALFWMVCDELGFGMALSLGLTAFYAFGSQAFSTSSQILWQHGPGVLFAMIALFCFLQFDQTKRTGPAIGLSLATAANVAVRPMNVLLVAPLVLIAVWKHRRFMALLLPGIAVGTLLIAYNLYYFGNIVGGLYDAPLRAPVPVSGLSFTNNPSVFVMNLAGLLFSPGRGLFIYFPIAAIAVGAFIIKPLRQPLAIAIVFSITLSVVLFSSYRGWMGGWCFGPRYMTEVEPLILLLLGMVWQAFSIPQQRFLRIACFYILLPYSVAIQALGTYSLAPLRWNQEVDGPQAVWYVRDNPIFKGIESTAQFLTH